MSNPILEQNKIENLKETLRVLGDDKTKLLKEINSLVDQRNEIEASIVSRLNEVKKKEDRVAIDQQASYELIEILENTKSQITSEKNTILKESQRLDMQKAGLELVKERIQDKLDSERAAFEKDIEEYKKEISDLEKERNLLIDSIEVLNSELSSYASKLTEVESKYTGSIRDHEEQLMAMRRQIEASQKELAKVNKELESQTTVANSIRLELETRAKDLDEKESNLMILRGRLESQIQEYFPHIQIKI